MRFFLGKRGDYDKTLASLKLAMEMRAKHELHRVHEQIIRENLLDIPEGYMKLPFAETGLAILKMHPSHGLCNELPADEVTGKPAEPAIPLVYYSMTGFDPEHLIAFGIDAYMLWYLSLVGSYLLLYIAA